eukprot:COSAG03_NODE_2606_length_2598_cov_2.649860_3_plen_193_part_00
MLDLDEFKEGFRPLILFQIAELKTRVREVRDTQERQHLERDSSTRVVDQVTVGDRISNLIDDSMDAVGKRLQESTSVVTKGVGGAVNFGTSAVTKSVGGAMKVGAEVLSLTPTKTILQADAEVEDVQALESIETPTRLPPLRPSDARSQLEQTAFTANLAASWLSKRQQQRQPTEEAGSSKNEEAQRIGTGR